MFRCASVCVLLSMLLLATGCEEAKEKAEEAGEAAKEKGSEAVEGAESLGEGAKALGETGVEKAGELAETAKGTVATNAGRASNGVAGELSASTTRMLAGAADSTKKGAVEMVVRGNQIVPIAIEITKAVDAAYDSSSSIEPIYQPIDGDTAETDAAIGEMPRTEVIDDVTVGFRDLSLTETDKHRKERGVLVVWRRDDHLVGFVYTSESQINLDSIVEDTPRIMKLVHSAL